MATVTQAARRLGISPGTVRNYGRRFSDHLSPGAHPEPGETRHLTDDDLRVMATAKRMLRGGMTYEQVLERLVSGVHLLEEAPTEADPAPSPQSTALVPAGQLLDRTMVQLDQAQARIAQLERQVGRLEGRLQEVTKPWWARVLGR